MITKSDIQKGTILTLNQKDTLIENGRQIDLIPVWQWCREKSRTQ